MRRLVKLCAACAAALSIPVMIGTDTAHSVGNTSFDLGSGASTYVTISDTPALRLSDNFTIEAWVYLRDNTNETIIDKGPVYSYLFQIYPNGQSGLGLYGGFGGNYQWVYSSAVTLPQNQWNHVAITFTNATNGLKFYANGNLVSEHTPAGALVSSLGDVNLGRQEPGGCNCNLLNGRLDEVRIWSTARTQAQLQSTMGVEPPSDSAGLIAYWDFNDGSGSTVTNRTSGAGMNGTIVNFPGNSPWVAGVPRTSSTAAASGLGDALDNFVWGPSPQSSSNPWQYFEIPDDLSSATLLANWQKTGNEVVSHQNQWDNNRVNGNYPFVQYIHSPVTSAFGGSAALMLHADDSNKRASVGWKNTTGSTATIDLDATLKFAYPGNNFNGATYALHRGLSGTARYLLLDSGTMSTGSVATVTLDRSVEIQNGELIYLSVGNNGQYWWDHTIVTMSVAIPTPVNTVAPAVTGTVEPGETLSASSGTWTGSPSSFAYQWKRSTTANGSYSNIGGATANSYPLTNADNGYYFKVAVTASNAGGTSSAVLSSATGVVATTTSTTTSTTTTIWSTTSTVSPTTTAVRGTTTTVAQTVSVTTTTSSVSSVVPTAETTSGSVVSTETSLAGRDTIPQMTTPTFAPGSLSGTASRAATSTTAAPTTTLPPTTTIAVVTPVIGDVASGSAEVRIGGATEPSTVRREEGRLVVSAGGLTTSLAAVDDDGLVASLDENGNVRLRPGGKVRVELDGYAPETDVQAWLFSDPIRLGVIRTSATGTVSGDFALPDDVENGEHRMALVAAGADGNPVTVTIGVMVGQSEGGSGVTVWLIVLPIVLAVTGALMIPATRRRRESKA